MASSFCPKCGRSNLSGSAFCAYCGNPLTASGTPQQQPPVAVPVYTAPPAPPPPSPYYGYAASFYEQERAKGIDRTKTGLLLIVIGFFMGWVPFVGLIGNVLEIIGAIMVILGRHTFGRDHARNVLWAIIIFVVGLIATIIAIFVIVFSIIGSTLRTYNSTTTPSTSPTFGSFNASFTAALIVGITISGLAYVIFTYALQNKQGRILLWAAYAANITASIVNLFVLNLNLFLTAIPSLFPAILYGYAYYLARDRIVRGEIPPPPVQPSPGTTGYTVAPPS